MVDVIMTSESPDVSVEDKNDLTLEMDLDEQSDERSVTLAPAKRSDDLASLLDTAEHQLNELLRLPTMSETVDEQRAKRVKFTHSPVLTATMTTTLPLDNCLKDHIGPKQWLLYTMTSDKGKDRITFQDKQRSYTLLARASSIDYRLWDADTSVAVEADIQAARLGLDFGKKPDAAAPSKFYVGFSALHMEPAFMSLANDQNDKSPIYRITTEPSEAIVATDIIWHHNLTVPGNIKALKFLISDHEELGNYFQKTRKELLMDVAKENRKLFEGGPMTPVTHIKPDINPPNFDLLYATDGDGIDRHWSLEWPPLVYLTLPLQLIDEVKNFFRNHPTDTSMDVSTAVAAVIIYFDLTHKPTTEVWARASQAAGTMPTVSLSVFLVYFPHMLRLVAELKLSRHIHPIRFASFHYRRDCKVDHKFEISDDGLDVTLMRDLYIRIASKNPVQDPMTRINLLPHSFYGSGLEWPTFLTSYSASTEEEVHAIGKIPDVRTIGLPKYSWLRSPLRRVTLPEPWYQDRYMGDESPSYGLLNDYEQLVNPSLPGNMIAVTGKSQFAGPVWHQIGGSAVMGSTTVPTSDDEGLMTKLEDYPVQSFLPKILLSVLGKRLDTRLRFAQYLRIPLAAISANGLLSLQWDTIEQDIDKLRMNPYRWPTPASQTTFETNSSVAMSTVNPEIVTRPSELILVDYQVSDSIENEFGGFGFLASPMWVTFLEMVRNGSTVEPLLEHVDRISEFNNAQALKINRFLTIIRECSSESETLQIQAAALPHVVMGSMGIDFPLLSLDDLEIAYLDSHQPIEAISLELDYEIDRAIVQAKRRKEPAIIADNINKFVANLIMNPQQRAIAYCRDNLHTASVLNC